SDDVLVTSISVNDGAQVTINGSTVTVNPAADLDPATRYFVEIDLGFVTDAAGNPFDGLANGANKEEEAFDFVTALPSLNAAPVALGPGSIAFTGFNAEGQRDDFAIVALTDLNGANAPFQIFFTDREFNGTSFLANDGVDQDGALVWTVDENIAAGTVINFSELGITNGTPFDDFAADRGLIQRGGGTFTFEGGIGGDEIYAYIGAENAPTAFLGAISTEASAASLTNTGLVYGQTAADFGAVDANADAARYLGDRSTQSTFADYLPFLNSNLATDFEIEDDGTSGEGFSPFDATPFTLDGTDVSAPNLVSLSPADEDADVAIGSDIVLTFNENVVAGSGNITIREFSTDAVFAQFAVGDAEVTFGGTSVTVNPTGNLAEGTRYYIQVDSGAITDSAGNGFSGITNKEEADFSTALPNRGEAPDLAAGDIAFTGFNFDQTEDDLAFVVLQDLDGSTEAFDIFFSDRPWDGSAFTDPDELDGFLRWTVNEQIAAGTVVTFTDIGTQNGNAQPGLSESHGLITRIGTFSPEQFGETVYAYTSLTSTEDDVPAQFLAALSTGNSDALNFGTLTGTGLQLGETALDFSDQGAPDAVAAADYVGTRDSEAAFEDYLPLVNDITAFTVVGTASGDSLVPFDTTAFTLTAPPGLTVSIDAAEISEADGADAATVTVTREGDTSENLVVTLTSSDVTQATLAPTLTILAGQSSASTGLDAQDDALLDGTQTVEITAMATGFDSGSDSVDVTDDEALDTTPPNAPVIVSFADDSGIEGDQTTSDRTPSFALTAEAGSTVEVVVSGILVGSTSADGDGNATFTLSPQNDGVISVTARARDAAGNVSRDSIPFLLEIDTEAPNAPSAPILFGPSDSGPSSADNLTNVLTPEFLIVGAEPGSTVSLISDIEGEIGTGLADNGGLARIISNQQLGEGVRNFTAIATDAAGNASEISASRQVEFDV
ncbi:MAG: Ig-like domain-containing protein, partial [Pseudomonadota bacterium]